MGAAEKIEHDTNGLTQTIATHLGTDDRGASHLIDTTRRLIGKYPFIEEIFKSGTLSANLWQLSGSETKATTLTDLLQQNQNLTLMDLDTHDIKIKPHLPKANKKTRQESRHKIFLRIVLIIVFLIALGVANYFILTAF